MDSLYAEVVVKPRQPFIRNTIAAIVYLAAIAFFIASCVSANLFGTMMPVLQSIPMIIVIVAITTYFYHRGRIEYEYIYCDDVITIAKITNKSKRKNIASIETDNIELFAPMESNELKRFSNLKKVDFASARKKGDVYGVVTPYQGSNSIIMLEPSEKMLSCMKIKLGRKYVNG